MAATYSFQERLGHRFRKQQSFSLEVSPLYARLNGMVAGWLTEADHPVSRWLVAASRGRSSFEVPMLLMAGVHRLVLAGRPEAGALAGFFPTAGGRFSAGGDGAELESLFSRTILDAAEELTRFISTATVQTNETGRGLCWLVPLASLPWEQVRLVELGASAGLNLLADQRHYQLRDIRSGQTFAALGRGQAPQFQVACSSAPGNWVGQERLPQISSRLGCDLAPWPLSSREDELSLAAFIWGDQVERLARLEEGIQAFRRFQGRQGGLRVLPADLPRELTPFLEEQLPAEPSCPVVLYASYLSRYLADKGASLRPLIAAWAGKHATEVLWLQLDIAPAGPAGLRPPQLGWLLWQADLWQQGRHHHWDLGWCHPHGSTVWWLPGMEQWLSFWTTA
ncbi:DUF2332 domain-containing protein [Desulfogranum mediterraneum]|uniref:DUF2332 domain-containing protein n=1 Tax=Desulfogranum mediterraneum TaxID=160661 RepID=UPI0003FE2BC9|nr:DUF2332 domain-containing protein [Desulfogranum mediterraneum]